MEQLQYLAIYLILNLTLPGTTSVPSYLSDSESNLTMEQHQYLAIYLILNLT